MDKTISFVIVLVLLSLISWLLWTQYSIGKQQSDYKIVCIYGHEYYRANFTTKGFLGIKLNADGKPVQCN
jgi:hypothetical protein